MNSNLALDEFIFKRKRYPIEKNLNPDRRSGVDRRKCINRDYLSNGGLERRSWRERRKLWYMTM
jgi:hypothetical protein